MRFWFSRTSKKNGASAANKAGTSTAKPLDLAKWRALIEHDEGVAAIAENLRPLGDKWVDEFARNYLSLSDKRHTWIIVRKVIEDAKRERDQAAGI
jgi:hypothetical protein